jgi:hypothetical protein
MTDCSSAEGAPVTRREAQGLEVFTRPFSTTLASGRRGASRAFDVGILEPHGDDLAGFR